MQQNKSRYSFIWAAMIILSFVAIQLLHPLCHEQSHWRVVSFSIPDGGPPVFENDGVARDLEDDEECPICNCVFVCELPQDAVTPRTFILSEIISLPECLHPVSFSWLHFARPPPVC